ncbi:hypothetical protein [Escherichia phage AV124]|nr:hypothetical protein [Escherichia phage AV124]
MEENIDYSEIVALAKRLKMTIMNRGASSRHVIRFTMKRRWGGVKKYAYECTLGTLVAHVNQIERMGGKIVGIDN